MLARILLLLVLLSGLAYLFLLSVLLSHNYVRVNHHPDEHVSSKSAQLLAQTMLPTLLSLVKMPYFRFFRVNLSSKCLFFPQSFQCSAQCEVDCTCTKDRVPLDFLEEDQRLLENSKYSQYQLFDFVKPFTEETKHDWSFDEVGEDSVYVDLVNDKESFTAYQGQHIWKSIYEENCVKFFNECGNSNLLFKMISGMHASVSSHLTEYFIDFGKNLTFPNPQMYYEKVGKFPDRIDNLIFAWSFLLRAFIRYHDIISSFQVKTNDFQTDLRTKALLQTLYSNLDTAKDYSFSLTSDMPETPPSLMLLETKSQNEQFSEIFLKFFRNITRIMDCVECKKCKVYGKMQVLGMGVSLRILMNPEQRTLSRNELVAFVNTLAKWTESVVILGHMKSRIIRKNFESVGVLTAFFAVLGFILVLGWLKARSWEREKRQRKKDE